MAHGNMTRVLGRAIIIVRKINLINLLKSKRKEGKEGGRRKERDEREEEGRAVGGGAGRKKTV